MRDFARTAEPRGQAGKRRKPAARGAPHALSFVVQRHDARRLHYDFRLELGGVLLSWAVPKGPSLDPADKRLAVETEPHPLEYGKFEGTIPQGEYGAGSVAIWDHGSWEPEGDPQAGYERGRLTFALHGERLNGTWHLVRTKTRESGKDEKNWLLMKSRDEFARDGDGEPESGPVPRAKANPVPRAKAKPVPHAKAKPARRAKVTNVSERVEPELATLVSAAPEGDDWFHELKFDGYRLLPRLSRAETALFTRNGHDWSERMPALVRAFSRIDADAWLDGEVVALDERGVSNFQRLQNSLSEGKDGSLVFYAFDLLSLDGTDYRNAPLTERKRLLAELWRKIPQELRGTLRLSDHVVGNGPAFFAKACELGVEGIVSKRADAPYRAGRGRDWLKVKCLKRQEFAIVGYTEPSGSRSHLGALLLALHGPDGFKYAGRVGTGFSAASLAELHRALEPLGRKTVPALRNAPRGADARDVHWVEPKLVAEIAFTDFTADGVLRHPSFQGLRDDKSAVEAHEERPADDAAPARGKRTPRAKSNDYPLTHPDKILYPEQGITKRELLDYYALVAERLLPHVANRPLVLVRCPNGFGKPCFFQKHPGEGMPPAVRSVPISERKGDTLYSVIDDAQGLFGLVQLGALEIHTWGSHAGDAEHPDLLVLDLDPDPDVEFGEVCRAAQELRQVFEAARLESFVKTAGGKGLHVCVPMLPELSWTEAKDFTQRIAEEFVRRAPERFVATQSKSKRRGKIFIDYLRNARGATFVAPYSTRARENAPIAAPLEWDELGPKLRPADFTLRNIAARLSQQRSDPFERMARCKQSLRALLASDAGQPTPQKKESRRKT